MCCDTYKAEIMLDAMPEARLKKVYKANSKSWSSAHCA